MSAFVVDDRTINGVVTFLANTPSVASVFKSAEMRTIGFDITTAIGRSNLGDAMFRLNCIAVDQRYGDGQCKEFRPMDYRFKPATVSAMQAYASLRCWLYQCSEGDVPETSALYKAMDAISDTLSVLAVKEVRPSMVISAERAHRLVRELDAWSQTYWS